MVWAMWEGLLAAICMKSRLKAPPTAQPNSLAQEVIKVKSSFYKLNSLVYICF